MQEAQLEPTGWQARLRLGFFRDGARTVLGERAHHGPLRVQRVFHPEPGGACHVYLLHPPGGVVGGDRLSLDAELEPGAHALLTTPAAQKFYRSNGARARVEQRLRVGPEARLEWLPQETIVWSGARAEQCTQVSLARGARFVGWEITCLGRPASGERFERGELVTRTVLTREGAPLFVERGVYRGGDPLLRAAFGLRGEPVIGTMLCVREGLSDDALDLARAALASCERSDRGERKGLVAATRMGEVLVVRYLGPSGEEARLCFARVWQALRPSLLDAIAMPPRIWST